MRQSIEDLIRESIEAKEGVLQSSELLKGIQQVTEEVIKVYQGGRKLLICGNGGSAADSQHMAAEFVSKFKLSRRGLPALALNTNTSTLTSIGNDYDYTRTFERQVEAFGVEGDLLIGISTSGNSENIVLAFQKARAMGVTTVGLLGKDGGKLKSVSDIALVVPADDTPRIQECQLMIEHIICELVEKRLFG